MEGIDQRSQVDFFPTNEQDERLIFMLGENLMLNVISSKE
jgi:hypothetical protein